ncbi:hypothetical protein FPV25_03085 [Carnobacterium sp. PL17GRE32]|uniref:hypothetical protein n=1 Tax=Carnobacterium sp. PL17GRE32 TaxID=2592355 RepID=UPI0013FCEF9D|nr:hypothetical protein [Carnobacterium sp. PL17GRE32]KAF3306015.1 hypothetical protein FPV25_03085 [Carnobacterium sp. PL17GRE32]
MKLQEEILKIKNEMIDEFDRRVEALKVDEQEFPKRGDKYHFIEATGRIDWFQWNESDFGLRAQDIGNIYKTDEEAQFAREKLKVEAELRKFSRPFMWGTENTAILFDGDGFKFDTRLAYVFQGTIYFESEEKAKQAIQSVGEDRIKKYIFGVED